MWYSHLYFQLHNSTIDPDLNSDHSHISHNTPCCLHNLCFFLFFLGITTVAKCVKNFFLRGSKQGVLWEMWKWRLTKVLQDHPSRPFPKLAGKKKSCGLSWSQARKESDWKTTSQWSVKVVYRARKLLFSGKRGKERRTLHCNNVMPVFILG